MTIRGGRRRPRWRPRLALAGFAGLVAAFTLALLTLPARGLTVPECGCFGAFVPGGSLAVTLVRNLVLLALCLFALARSIHEPERRERKRSSSSVLSQAS